MMRVLGGLLGGFVIVVVVGFCLVVLGVDGGGIGVLFFFILFIFK